MQFVGRGSPSKPTQRPGNLQIFCVNQKREARTPFPSQPRTDYKNQCTTFFSKHKVSLSHFCSIEVTGPSRGTVLYSPQPLTGQVWGRKKGWQEKLTLGCFIGFEALRELCFLSWASSAGLVTMGTLWVMPLEPNRDAWILRGVLTCTASSRSHPPLDCKHRL